MRFCDDGHAIPLQEHLVAEAYAEGQQSVSRLTSVVNGREGGMVGLDGLERLNQQLNDRLESAEALLVWNVCLGLLLGSQPALLIACNCMFCSLIVTVPSHV